MSNIGYRIIDDFERPAKELMEEFRNIPTPNIGDSMNRIAAIDSSIKSVNKVKLLGPAYTVNLPAGDNLLFYYAIDQAKPGDIIVVSGGGYTERALCGEIMVNLAIKRNLGGFLIDGAIRDIEDLRNMDFAVFAKSTSPNGPYKNGPGEINVPVNIGGKVIYPGDIIVGDSDGVVIIKPEDAITVKESVDLVMKKESKMLEKIEKEGILDLDWMYEKLNADNCKIMSK